MFLLIDEGYAVAIDNSMVIPLHGYSLTFIVILYLRALCTKPFVLRIPFEQHFFFNIDLCFTTILLNGK